MTKRPIIKIFIPHLYFGIDVKNLRFYMGRHVIKIIFQKGKKALIEHQQSGYVGNQKVGYKSVCFPMRDIVLIRHCYKNRRGGLNNGK